MTLKKIFTYSICFFLLLVCAKPKFTAQTGNFVTYGLQEGLVMSQIETVVQDNDGFLWVGTIAGLSRYDGVKFTNYTQKEGLAEDWITSSILLNNGDVLFGHWGGGISLYSQDGDSIIDLKVEKYSKYRLITCLAQDENGVIWAGTENVGLFTYNLETEKGARIDEGLISNNITGLAFDHNQKLWVTTTSGISILNAKSANKLSLVTNYKHPNKGSNNLTCVLKAYDKEMWFGTSNNGIVKIKYTDAYKKSEFSLGSISKKQGLSSNSIKTLYKDSEENVWIGTKDQGIVQFIPSKSKNKGLSEGQVNIFSNKFEMKYYHANAFVEDREGNIWIGTEIGLNKYMGDVFRVYNHNDNLINNLVWCVIQDSKERMWFGTTDGISVFTFPVISGRKQYNNPTVFSVSTSDGLSENIIISLLEAKSGKVWAGTENSGVNILDSKGKVIKKLTTDDGLLHNKVFSICEDKDGFIWLGTKAGAVRINPNNYKIETFTSENGLGGEKVYKIFKDSKDNLWFGILGGALTKYNGKTFKTYEEGDGLYQKFILSIAEDKNGSLWFGTYGDGIISYDGSTFKSYTVNEGLSSNSTHFITCDANNNIWIGQSLGIERFNRKNETFSLYGKQQGFSGLETNENAVTLDKSGNIWFGTLRGAIKFDPSKDRVNNIEPLTYIENVDVFFNEANLEKAQVLNYYDNYLTFKNLAISLTNPSEVRYKYFLEGFDQDWSPETKSNEITYSNLSPGSYTFNVKAVNNSGLENSEATKYTFKIKPPFWKTWWFYTLCVLAVLFGIITFIKQREKKLKERQEYLESEVKKRTQELLKEKEVVEKQNKNITESISYAKRIQQAILPPMESVKASLPESFILYQPKDIVSGDFYWIHETDEKILFAAVDCTGHGVPGAFMSIIGHNLLDKVVKENQVTSPGPILDLLSIEISKTLRQDNDDVGVKDGMDIAICSINKKTNELEFAGAYNPLYLVRKGEISEVKSDKIPIGKGGKIAKKGSFNNQVIQLQSGDMLYIFSDGYADQKGGAKNKKFYYPPFRELLTEVSVLSNEKQKQKLEATMKDWKGGTEQYDDMLIIGVKIK